MAAATRGLTERRAMAAAAMLLPLLGACGAHDPVDTPLTWWHQLEGGAIAQQRPPPPGVDDPYPKVGTTPAKAPVVASVELRHSVTSQLVEQRNLSQRLNAHDPLPPPSTVPADRQARAAAPAPPNPAQSSATLDAAEAPPPTAGQKSAAPAGTAPAPDPGELTMPALVQPDPQVASAAGVPLPPIPDVPPPPPGLPGIALPPPPSYVAPKHPNYVLADVPGDALQFQPGSDVLAAGQAGTLRALAGRRGTGTIYVHGFGEAASDTPADQAQAVTLAVLRARAVAEALQQDGVPSGAIRIRADAFGRGARAGLVD